MRLAEHSRPSFRSIDAITKEYLLFAVYDYCSVPDTFYLQQQQQQQQCSRVDCRKPNPHEKVIATTYCNCTTQLQTALTIGLGVQRQSTRVQAGMRPWHYVLGQ